MELRLRLSRRRVALAALLVGLVTAGVAYAAIPDGNGVFTACKLNATGTIRLIDTSLGSTSLLGRCTSLETQLTWNQGGPKGPLGDKGPTGDKGPIGDKGPAGDPGVTGTSGYEVVSAQTGENETTPKLVAVVCPAGKHLLGGGARVLTLRPGGAFLSINGPSPGNPEHVWIAEAGAVGNATSGVGYSLAVWGICADE